MNFFGKKPTVQGKNFRISFEKEISSPSLHWFNFTEQVRENDKALRKVTRDVERDRRELEREEKKLEAEIKKAAKMGNKQAATVLAKQLINVRKQKTRTYNMTSKVGASDIGLFIIYENISRFKLLGAQPRPWVLMLR